MAICHGLSLVAIPHLGVYNRDQYLIFDNKVLSLSISNLPSLLESQISSLCLESARVEYFTIRHSCADLSKFGASAHINLLYQPYIFFDSEPGQKHECTVKAAVYIENLEFIKAHIQDNISDSIRINPEDINKCNVFTCIHPEGEDMCLSPNNARLNINTFVPVHIFFSMMLLPYKGKIVKMLVTKHVLVIDEELFMRCKEIKKFLALEISADMIAEILETLGGHEGWTWYIHNIVWRISGKPQSHEFGKQEWTRLVCEYYENMDEEALFKIIEVLNVFIREVSDWVKFVEENID